MNKLHMYQLNSVSTFLTISTKQPTLVILNLWSQKIVLFNFVYTATIALAKSLLKIHLNCILFLILT